MKLRADVVAGWNLTEVRRGLLVNGVEKSSIYKKDQLRCFYINRMV